MKIKLNSIYYNLSLLILILITYSSNIYSQGGGKSSWTVYTGLFTEKVEVVNKNIIPEASNSVSPIGWQVGFSNYIKNIGLRIDVRYKKRSFETGMDSAGRSKVEESEIQFQPEKHFILFKHKKWIPWGKYGVYASYALNRNLTDANNTVYQWKKARNRYTLAALGGLGVTHKKSNLFLDLTFAYIYKPDSTPDNNSTFNVNWSPLAFNASIGFLFGL